MKQCSLGKSAVRAALTFGVCLGGSTTYAQLTSAQIDNLKEFVGQRAELAVILGASDSVSGASYTIDGRNGGDETEYDLYKFGGKFPIGESRALGDSGVEWRPVIVGVLGYMTGDNEITTGPLIDNEIEESALGLQFGAGAEFQLTEHFKITPFAGLLYGHYEIELSAENAVGEAVEDYVDQDADTIGGTPGVSLAYQIPWKNVMFELSSTYTLFATTDISSDDSALEMDGTSHVLENKLDVDVLLPAEIKECPLHTGGYVSRTDIFGDAEDVMRSSDWYTIHARIYGDTTGKLWKFSKLGIGASYITADDFDGVSIGLEVGFKF